MALQAAAGALALACPCDNLVMAALPAGAQDLAQARRPASPLPCASHSAP